MAGVLKRTSNSVTVQIAVINNTDWQKIIVGGSVIFKWKVTPIPHSLHYNYFINFSKRNLSEKVNFMITYTHWQAIDEMDVMKVRTNTSTNRVGAVYCASSLVHNHIKEVTVEIFTIQSRPCGIIYDDDDLTDFMLRGEDGSVPFHKAVIAAHSSVFKTMLAGEWKETSEGVIDFPGTSKEMLQHLKTYMYLGKLPEKHNEEVNCIKQLLLLSSCYLMEELKLRCIKELRFLLTVDNVFDMIQFAVESKNKLLHIEIMDSAAMGDIDICEIRKLVEAEDATILKCDD